jgi:hypothetical protein
LYNSFWRLSLRQLKTHFKKQVQMKKVFAILVVAGFLASCSSGPSKEQLAADSTRIADSTAKAQMAADSAAKAAMDTTHADTTKPKM